MNAVPFRVTAKLRGPMMRPAHGIYLDSLLMARVAVMEQRVPLDWQPDQPESEIPIAKSACGRVFLASASLFQIESSTKGYTNRRFPMAEAQSMSALSLKRIQVSAGLSKGSRIPREMVHVVNDQVVWFALGDPVRTEEILQTVSGLGARRGAGHGEVDSWTVEEIEPWEGFPVMSFGSPLRTLPLDWPGLGECHKRMAVLYPPYFERWREELCADVVQETAC